jgi:protein-tyrosine-phosphatase
VLSTEEFLGLVADPQRWQLLTALAATDRRVGELTELTGKPQNLVSYHLGQLRSAGLISARRSSADGRDTYYRAELARCAEMFDAARSALYESPPVVRTKTPRVLFLCTGNSARSQMAEALLEARSGGAIEARSAGSHPKALHPEAVRVMAARGIDIAGRPTKNLARYTRARFDRVITLCDKVKEICPEFPGDPTTAHWSMPDPAAETDADAFERAADDIERRVALLIDQLATTRKERT